GGLRGLGIARSIEGLLATQHAAAQASSAPTAQVLSGSVGHELRTSLANDATRNSTASLPTAPLRPTATIVALPAATESPDGSAKADTSIVPVTARSPLMSTPMVTAATTQHLTPSQKRRFRKHAARAAAEATSSQASSPSPVSCRPSAILAMSPAEARSQGGNNAAASHMQALRPLEANSVQGLSVEVPLVPSPSGASVKDAASASALATRKRKTSSPAANTAINIGDAPGKNSRSRQDMDQRSQQGSGGKRGPEATVNGSRNATQPTKPTEPASIGATHTARPGLPAQSSQTSVAATTATTIAAPSTSQTRTPTTYHSVPIRAPRSPPRSFPVDERLAPPRDHGNFAPRGCQDHYWGNGYHDRDYNGGSGYEQRDYG
ncbi:hypothetical protein P7C70_g9495, partial [Phenoliferia sp. Uapishka_3]